MKFINDLFKKKELAKLIKNSIKTHKTIESLFSIKSKSYIKNKEKLSFPNLKLNSLDYFSKNAFSILIISIFKTLKINEDKIIPYGVIMHSIREIVTSGDNILDKEDKGSIKIKMKAGRILSNIMAIIIETNIINDTIMELNPKNKQNIFQHLLTALFDIAEVESAEEKGILKIEHPDYVLNSIHSFRGGKLLELAFAVPEICETKIDLSQTKKAISSIGVAIQILDDITDFKIDYDSKNFNILHSWIIHYQKDGNIDLKDFHKTMQQAKPNPKKSFPIALGDVLDLAISYALKGFAILEEANYPITKKEATSFIKLLFHLRKLDSFWKHIKPKG